MKILTTQIGGLLQRIASNNEEAIGETARLLAQASVGEGRVVFAGFGELEAVVMTALEGIEPFKGAIRYEDGMPIEKVDRVWLLTRSSEDEKALRLARSLSENFIPFAALAAEKLDDSNALADFSYTYLSTGLTRGLLPGVDGERIVQPHALAALFIYEAVKMAYDEILMDS
ncbi:DUF2529 family protein [Sporosarcina sp. HYO08]|uniref:DUF2529 family protein n=1 Tax=Sporosarcina sp. HYO08 TaxID=1759557 RepID=UPI0020A43EB9|nr:DUF2529 family protein [Sporosarcina sp. HYO08]